MRKTIFAIEGFEQNFVGYTDGTLWNGWAKPYFTKEVADQIMHINNAENNGTTMYYNSTNDRYVRIFHDDDGLTEIFGGYDIDGMRLYDIGTTCWIWEEVAQTDYSDLTPSWYIYTDCDGEAHVQTFSSASDNKDVFFTDVSRKICFDDCTDETVQKIYYKGKEVRYAGWQRGMKFEYKDLDGNTVWVGYFEHWDH